MPRFSPDHSTFPVLMGPCIMLPPICDRHPRGHDYASLITTPSHARHATCASSARFHVPSPGLVSTVRRFPSGRRTLTCTRLPEKTCDSMVPLTTFIAVAATPAASSCRFSGRSARVTCVPVAIDNGGEHAMTPARVLTDEAAAECAVTVAATKLTLPTKLATNRVRGAR